MEFNLTEDNRFLEIKECSKLELEQLRLSLTKRIENWRFNPRVQSGGWDGYYCYLLRDKYIPAGLWKEVLDIARKYNYPIIFNDLNKLFDNNVNQEDFNDWANNFFNGFKLHGEPIDLREYQLETSFRILKFRKCSAELATSAGKTLISFMTVGYMLQKNLAKKILFIVPNVNLVTQANDDFNNYNYKNQIKLKIEMIFSGQKPKPESNIVIGTYQSLVKKKAEYFEQFDSIIVDECLHPDTLITMANNTYKKISNIVTGDLVKTFNIKTKSIEVNEVDYVHKNLSISEDMYEIEMDDSSIIKITGNHKVQLTTGIWKRVDELELSDEILNINDFY